jgi:ribosome-associated protein
MKGRLISCSARFLRAQACPIIQTMTEPRALEPIAILESEVELSAIRAQGSGGQNVNKVSSAIHLRFDIPASSLASDVKERLLALRDSRITNEGVLIIKAQSHSTQEMNRLDAFARLHEVVNSVARPPRIRRATKPSYGSKQRRLEGKSQRSQTKTLRGRVKDV